MAIIIIGDDEIFWIDVQRIHELPGYPKANPDGVPRETASIRHEGPVNIAFAAALMLNDTWLTTISISTNRYDAGHNYVLCRPLSGFIS